MAQCDVVQNMAQSDVVQNIAQCDVVQNMAQCDDEVYRLFIQIFCCCYQNK